MTTNSKTGRGVFAPAPSPGTGIHPRSNNARPPFDQGVALPSTRVGPPQPAVAEIVVGDGGREAVPRSAAGGRMPDAAGEYPVPGRTAEYNRRIAIHEGAGHAFLARCMGTELKSVSIIPDSNSEGRCLSAAYKCDLDGMADDQTTEISDLCERVQKLMPPLGMGRVESAEFFQRATVLAIELVAGTVAEQILHPHEAPLPTHHDQLEAAAFAGVAVASPGAIPAFLEYAKGEAAALIGDNPDVAMAIADGLVEHGSLTGDQVDAIIASAIATKAAAVERQRRADWQRRCESAARFVDYRER
jgi:hypothetical protein